MIAGIRLLEHEGTGTGGRPGCEKAIVIENALWV
jgi:hypothetical protein